MHQAAIRDFPVLGMEGTESLAGLGFYSRILSEQWTIGANWPAQMRKYCHDSPSVSVE